MENCYVCKKEFDPSNEFIEDIDMLESLMYWLDGNDFYYCNDCLYNLHYAFNDIANRWKNGTL